MTIHGGPTSRLRARAEFAYRLFDFIAEKKSTLDLGLLAGDIAAIEHELAELFGPRPTTEDRVAIRSRTEHRPDDDLR